MPRIFIALVTVLTCQLAIAFSHSDSIKLITDIELTSDLNENISIPCSGAMWRSSFHTPIHGGWTNWGSWLCSVTCGTGRQVRSRSCTNPPPSIDGNNCVGSGYEFQDCNPGACPVNGSWTTWGSWASCSATCGVGTQLRARSCTSPAPSGGGSDCSGSSSDSKACNNTVSCSAWTNWGSWSLCSCTCTFTSCSATGRKTRSRTCGTGSSSTGGTGCVGSSSDSSVCVNVDCKGATRGINAYGFMYLLLSFAVLNRLLQH